jgi:chlorobactene glucosyltransferase
MTDLPIHQIGVVGFLTVALLITLSNLRAVRRVERYSRTVHFPRVSVLIPARNEEQNIEACVSSVLAQDYPTFELWVLNDHSTDRTGEILAALAAADDRLHLLAGADLPPGWLGKHWACHQLAQAATGDLLLFTDADTVHHPALLHDAVSALVAEQADLLSVFVRQEVVTWAERLIVPMFSWAFFALLPFALAHRLRLPQLSASIGQFLLFRRAAFEQIGGYAAIRGEAVDDLALTQRIKAAGLRWRMVDATARLRCRMYHSAREVYAGFTKNLFAAFEYRLLPYLFIWGWMLLVTWEPLIVLLLKGLGQPVPAASVGLAAVAIVESWLVWGLPYRRLRLPLYTVPLYPLSTLLDVIVALRSLRLALRGTSTWKGRTLGKPKIRLL